MAGTQHTPRLAHTQTAFVWRFLALSAGESQIIHVTARTEREARNRCPSGCVAVFAARIRQEGVMNKIPFDVLVHSENALIRAKEMDALLLNLIHVQESGDESDSMMFSVVRTLLTAVINELNTVMKNSRE